nr:hypothetical protein [Phytoactinopolyspora endophytica]
MAEATARPAHPASRLLAMSAPALVIGVGSAVMLVAVFAVADRLERLLWESWPSAMGVPEDAA